MKHHVVISHNNKSYSLKVGGWLKNLHSDFTEAMYTVHTDDIVLPCGTTAGSYRKAKKVEYDAINSSTGPKKHLNQSSINDYGCGWDELIQFLKNRINESCLPLLFANGPRSVEEQVLINKAASNGHVGAMYWIGMVLSDGLNENCLLWLSMAHNRGHVGAAYAMAAFLLNEGNVVEALRCLIIAADSGCDYAFMTIFDSDLLKRMFQLQDVNVIESMLNQLIEVSYYSSARYYKSILLLIQNEIPQGLQLLREFAKNPKNSPNKKHRDEVYVNQLNHAKSLTEDLARNIGEGASIAGCLHDYFNKLPSGMLSGYMKEVNMISEAVKAQL
ncbi:hypothetical protein [Pseudoalteromonas rubra]|uniref:hypothetical protein n=1 Tax=Pseudoalteromonas rubra TaxID=43658 RepID=UPI000698B2D4|nr:hypothetical protein [Pseudoalteromonas rubra]